MFAMKKKSMIITAVLLLSLPQLNAQEPEPVQETTEETKQEAATGSEAESENVNPDPKKANAAAKEPPKANAAAKEPPKANDFSEQQKKIQTLLEKVKKTKKKADRHRAYEALKREQVNLRQLYKKKQEFLQMEISHLKEMLRINQTETRAAQEQKLAEMEAKLEALPQEANLEKWCAKPTGLQKAKNSTPNPGPGKKARKKKKK